MRTKFYMVDYSTNKAKKITKKQAMTYINQTQLKEALNGFLQNKYLCIEYMTRDGRLHIDFEI